MFYYKNIDNYNKLFDEVFQSMNAQTTQSLYDMKDNGDNYSAELVVPGADRQDFKITNQDNKLTVSYYPEKNKNKFCGSFSKSWKFTGVDFEKVSASYINGVLTIVVPKAKKAETTVRTIAVN